MTTISGIKCNLLKGPFGIDIPTHVSSYEKKGVSINIKKMEDDLKEFERMCKNEG